MSTNSIKMSNPFGRANMADVLRGEGEAINHNAGAQLEEEKLTQQVTDSENVLGKNLQLDTKNYVSTMIKQSLSSNTLNVILTTTMMVGIAVALGGSYFSQEGSFKGASSTLKAAFHPQKLLSLTSSTAFGVASVKTAVADENLGAAEKLKSDGNLGFTTAGDVAKEGSGVIDSLNKTNASIAGSGSTIIGSNYGAQTVSNRNRR